MTGRGNVQLDLRIGSAVYIKSVHTLTGQGLSEDVHDDEDDYNDVDTERNNDAVFDDAMQRIRDYKKNRSKLPEYNFTIIKHDEMDKLPPLADQRADLTEDYQEMPKYKNEEFPSDDEPNTSKRNSIAETDSEEAHRSKRKFLQGMYFHTRSGFDIVPIWSEKSHFASAQKKQDQTEAGAQMTGDSENFSLAVDTQRSSAKFVEVRFRPYFIEVEVKCAGTQKGFVKKCELPKGTKAQTIECNFYQDNGILQITVPIIKLS